jgi:hypothetical protein
VTKAPPEALLLFLKHAALEPNWTPAHSLKLPLNPFPAEQNWSFLADPSQRTDFFDPAKYIPFGDNPQMYFSIGFEYRIQYEYFDNWMFGAGPQDDHGYALNRAMPHVDFHAGSDLGLFSEFEFDYEG